ncbi:MAG: hypothetical protein KDD11_06630 [Acidobacteria bacterium]|nr:hypothetical protein [Acidobacteriota bacterium]
MKTIHLLRVDGDAETFAPLVRAAAELGLRVGWLELTEPEAPPSLARAAEAGVLRAVAAGSRRTVAVKDRRGPTVLVDLLREHFGGCRAVLVRGEIEAPRVDASQVEGPGEGWRVSAGAVTLDLSTEQLAARLRCPRPWSDPEP